MCILSYLRPGIAVDHQALWNGGRNNPDGHGWAIATGETMLVGKSMNLTEALDTFTEARKHHPEGHALFHSRWATHGSKNTDNVHPFYVGGSQRTVVAHNGILPANAWPGKGDDRSDTRLFADEILSTRYRRLNRDRVRKALSDWIGWGNKLVILTVDERYKSNAFLINSGAGTWDGLTGIWHSNHDYETDWTARHYPAVGGKTTTPADAKWWQEHAWEHCLYCNGFVASTGYCDDCGTCQDCIEFRDDCQCFNGQQAQQAQDDSPDWLRAYKAEIAQYAGSFTEDDEDGAAAAALELRQAARPWWDR